jgi:biotin operon repressor
VIGVHHSGKDTSKGMRGHSSLDGEITWSIEIRKGQDGLQSLLDKQNAGPAQDPEWYQLEPVDLPAPDGDIFPITSAVLRETTYRAVAEDREAQVLEFLSAEERIEEGASGAEIAAWLEPLSKASVNRVIRKLKEAGQIETQGQTVNLRYHLAGHLKLQRKSAYRLLDEPF